MEEENDEMGQMASRIWDHLQQHRRIELSAFVERWQLDPNQEQLMNDVIQVLSGMNAVRDMGRGDVWEFLYVDQNLEPDEWVFLTDEQIAKAQIMADGTLTYGEDPGYIPPPDVEGKRYKVIEQSYVGSLKVYHFKIDDDLYKCVGSDDEVL